SKARLLVDDVASGKSFFGAEGYLPALHPLVPLLEYLPDGASVVVEDPPGVVQAVREELTHAREGEASRHGLPHFPLAELYVDEDELWTGLERRRVVCAHVGAIAGDAARGIERLEDAPLDAPSLWTRDHADLARAVKAARTTGGKENALDPLLARLSVWRDSGLTV